MTRARRTARGREMAHSLCEKEELVTMCQTQWGEQGTGTERGIEEGTMTSTRRTREDFRGEVTLEPDLET